MKLSLLPILTSASLFALACANDPGKAVHSAQQEVTAAQQNAATTPATLDVKHTDEQLEQNRDQRTERAALATASDGKILSAEKNLAEAQVSMQVARRSFDSKATERFEKMEAIATEAKAKAINLPGKKRAAFDAALSNYVQLRDDAARRARDLRDASDESWASERDAVDKAATRATKAADDLLSIK